MKKNYKMFTKILHNSIDNELFIQYKKSWSYIYILSNTNAVNELYFISKVYLCNFWGFKWFFLMDFYIMHFFKVLWILQIAGDLYAQEDSRKLKYLHVYEFIVLWLLS